MILAVRSVPLQPETFAAWNTADLRFRLRDVDRIWKPHYGFDAVLNLGNLEHKFDDIPVPVFNPPSIIKAVSTPKSLRRTLGDYLPSTSRTEGHWHKRPGFGGKGKEFCDDWWCDTDDETQQHVEGQEFRVVTVGQRVVQASTKFISSRSRFDFDYKWVGVDGISKNGIIPVVKAALADLPDSELTVFGWDIIVGDQVWVLEINTSPGVNEPTAMRVTNAIKRSI